MTEINITHELDAKGLMCPEPVMMLHVKVKEMSSGDILKIDATDPSTKRDIAKFCNFLGYELLAQSEDTGVYEFLIKKP